MDTARTLYLVCYDVSCPKRLYRVHFFQLDPRMDMEAYGCAVPPALTSAPFMVL